MLKYYSAILLIMCLFTLTIEAQVLPQGIDNLVTINQKKLKIKKLIPKASQYDFFHLLLASYKRGLKDQYHIVESLYQSPETAGLNTQTNIYLFTDKVGNQLHQGIHFYIQNISLFEDAIDSLTQRERPQIGIPDNAPDALRAALLKKQAEQDAYWAQFRPKPVPNSNFKMLKLQKYTYAWTSDRAYIFQTSGLNEWQDVDEDNETIARQKFQEYKKARETAKQDYIKQLVGLNSLNRFAQTVATSSDITAWMGTNEAFNPLANPQAKKSPQASPFQLLMKDMFAFAEGEQTFTMDFEQSELLIQHKHRSRSPIPRSKTGTLPITFLQENALLSIENTYFTNATPWISSLYSYLGSDALYPISASETRLLHGFQKATIDFVQTTKRGIDTIKAEVALPVFTSFLAIDDPEKQANFIQHLVTEDILIATNTPTVYRSTDTSYTAYIVQHPSGLFWSMKSEITTPAFQEQLLSLIVQCPSAYKLVDMRKGVEELSLSLPALYTSYYRTLKNNWKSSTHIRSIQKGMQTNTIKLSGFKKAAPNNSSMDMLLEIVDSFFNQVQEEAKRRK